MLLIGGALFNQRTYRILGMLQGITAQKGEALFQKLDELDSVDLSGFFLSHGFRKPPAVVSDYDQMPKRRKCRSGHCQHQVVRY
ncbi:hypothetical protein ACI3L1_19345 [Deinococcus sp. SM5_A1]|uniref:hypothetical protein n=1 Tax=Deinococcus sp. SM5_A1 TaxID=3379094 RepID=UPI00385F4A7B